MHSNNRKSYKKTKIVINLQGGLGNQLFQLAAGITLAKLNDCDTLELYPHNLTKFKVARSFCLEPFILRNDNYIQIVDQPSILLNKYVLKGLSHISTCILSDNRIPHINLDQINVKKLILNGYFQQIDFLNSFSIDSIRQSFFSYVKQNNQFARFRKVVESNGLGDYIKNSYAIHIRGGDFLTDSYYSKINFIDLVSSLLKNQKRLIVFTDDETYSRNLLHKFNVNVTYVSKYHFTDIQEFYLMSECNKFIISNSSFSLFAAIIGYDKSKNVWAPDKWVSDSQKNQQLVKICLENNFNLYNS
jgi:hypothetical protein